MQTIAKSQVDVVFYAIFAVIFTAGAIYAGFHWEYVYMARIAAGLGLAAVFFACAALDAWDDIKKMKANNGTMPIAHYF